jgi:hypothetical protein
MRSMTRRRLTLTVGLTLAVAVPALVAVQALRSRGDNIRPGDRQAIVAERGSAVMPFDLGRTTHVFAKRRDGGVQTVVAKTSDDLGEVASVRRHLRAEAARFRRGEFDDPAAIHGREMPGLAELSNGVEAIQIRYADVRTGGRIRYSTSDPTLVRALHLWFDAQLMDHGADAVAMPAMAHDRSVP